jgi:hypothetical protein
MLRKDGNYRNCMIDISGIPHRTALPCAWDTNKKKGKQRYEWYVRQLLISIICFICCIFVVFVHSWAARQPISLIDFTRRALTWRECKRVSCLINHRFLLIPISQRDSEENRGWDNRRITALIHSPSFSDVSWLSRERQSYLPFLSCLIPSSPWHATRVIADGEGISGHTTKVKSGVPWDRGQ